MSRHILVILATLCIAYVAASAPESPHAVMKHGAKADGKSKDTKAVQQAIDACAKSGGGPVYFAPGVYLCGSLHLRTGVTLWLDPGATIMGSPDLKDFDPIEKLGYKNDADAETTFFHNALIWGEDLERIGIVGGGVIDMNRDKRHGPKAIALKRCKQVAIRDVRIQNIPNYTISMLGCEQVIIDGVTILRGYADGIDPDCCRDVRIANCHIESVDDAIVPKTSFALGVRGACENINVTNCILKTQCHGFKLGTESGGDFKRIAVSNCVITNLEPGDPGINGIALESVDGANIDGVVISNITMVDMASPIFIRLGNRGRDQGEPTPGSIQNVIISNVTATRACWPSSITGIPGHRPRGVILDNIRLMYAGSNALRPANDPVPEAVDSYPSPDIFGAMPAYGLYVRHVEDLTLDSVQLIAEPGFWRVNVEDDSDMEWPVDAPMAVGAQPGPLGSPLVCEDVQGLQLQQMAGSASSEGAALLRFINVRQALVRGCQAPAGTAVFLEVAGAESTGIRLTGNDLAQTAKPFALLPGADPGAVVND